MYSGIVQNGNWNGLFCEIASILNPGQNRFFPVLPKLCEPCSSSKVSLSLISPHFPFSFLHFSSVSIIFSIFLTIYQSHFGCFFVCFSFQQDEYLGFFLSFTSGIGGETMGTCNSWINYDINVHFKNNFKCFIILILSSHQFNMLLQN